jgi:hypothetical protein
MKREQLPPYLHSTYDLIVRAFPDGISDEDYFPLLAVFEPTEISARNLGAVLEAIDGRNYSLHYYNLLHELPYRKPRRADIDRVRAKLESVGFAAWLKEDDEQPQ